MFTMWRIYDSYKTYVSTNEPLYLAHVLFQFLDIIFMKKETKYTSVIYKTWLQ